MFLLKLEAFEDLVSQSKFTKFFSTFLWSTSLVTKRLHDQFLILPDFFLGSDSGMRQISSETDQSAKRRHAQGLIRRWVCLS